MRGTQGCSSKESGGSIMVSIEEREMQLRVLRLQIKTQLEHELGCIKDSNQEIALYIKDLKQLTIMAENRLAGEE